MLWIKAFHIIAVVCWFAGIFYLPRLFVYHTEASDNVSLERFKVMERRLYYGIMTPSGIIATLLGVWLLSFNWQGYFSAPWWHAKLSLVVLLWIYHLACGHYLKHFRENNNHYSARFYRIFNELPILLLIAIVILVVVKPF